MNERNQKEKASLATSLNEIVYLPENQININDLKICSKFNFASNKQDNLMIIEHIEQKMNEFCSNFFKIKIYNKEYIGNVCDKNSINLYTLINNRI